MKPVVMMAGAFLIGLVGATAVSRILTSPGSGESDTDAHPVDSTTVVDHDTLFSHAPVVSIDTAVHVAVDSATAVAGDAMLAPSAEIARIVAVLKGLSQADGGAVIALLDDATALEVLRAVGYSRAALLIGELPEARAATLGSGLVRMLTDGSGT